MKCTHCQGEFEKKELVEFPKVNKRYCPDCSDMVDYSTGQLAIVIQPKMEAPADLNISDIDLAGIIERKKRAIDIKVVREQAPKQMNLMLEEV